MVPLPRRASESDKITEDDTYTLYRAPSLAELMHSTEDTSNEVHCLRCENAHLVRRVQQLEAAVQETRVGDGHMHTKPAHDSEPETLTPSMSGAAAGCPDLVETSQTMHELVTYLIPSDGTHKAQEGLERIAEEWKEKKEILRQENESLEQRIHELREERTVDSGSSISQLEIQLSRMETTLRKSSRLMHALKKRNAKLEQDQIDFLTQRVAYDREREELSRQIDAEKRRRVASDTFLTEASERVEQLKRETVARETSLQRLESGLAETPSPPPTATETTQPRHSTSKRRSSGSNRMFRAVTRIIARRKKKSDPDTSPFKGTNQVSTEILDPSIQPRSPQSTPNVDLTSSTGIHSEEKEQWVDVMEQQFTAQQRLTEEARCQLEHEKTTRKNLQRLLEEGNTIMDSLVVSYKARLRDAHISIRQSTDGETHSDLMRIIELEFDRLINFLDRLQPQQHASNNNNMDGTRPRHVIVPSLDPFETRSGPIRM